jgi:hypothetical protein
MNGQKIRMSLLGSLALSVIIFLAVCVLGLSALEKKSQNMVELKKQSQDLDAQTANLNQAKKEVNKYKYFNDIAQNIIPTDKDQVEAFAELLQMANDSGILLQNVSFPASTLGTNGAVGSSASGSATPTTSATTTQKATNLISQAKLVPGIPGLYSIEIVVTPETGEKVPPSKVTNYNKMIAFLSKIEHDQRTAQITQVSIQPPKSGSTGANNSFTFTLNINIFIKP